MATKNNLNRLLPFCLTLGLLFGSCEKDVFNSEKVKETYENKFPIKDIDPSMDWKMTQQVSVDISVYEDYGENYTVEVYDNNPYSIDGSVHLLASGTANQDLSFRTVIDCPLALTTLYIARADKAGRRIFKPVSIINKKVTASFGGKANARSFSSATTRSENEFAISAMTRPYTDNEIAAMLSTAVEYVGQDMDANIANQTIFKVTGSYEGGLNHGGSLTPDVSTIKLIIAPGATWKISSPQIVNQGLEIIVASKGIIDLKQGSVQGPSLKFTNTASLTVLGPTYQEEGGDAKDARGQIFGHGWIEFANGGNNYSAGYIDIDGINNNGGTFFNYGKIIAGEVHGSSTGSLFVNHGELTAQHVGANDVGPQIDNACKIKVIGHLTTNGLRLAKGSLIECKFLHASSHLILDNHSMVDVSGNSYFLNCNIVGPTEDNSYALLRLAKIDQADWTGDWMVEVKQGYAINNIYCEYSNGGKANSKFVNECLNGKAGGNALKGNGNAVVCQLKEAPAYIPEGSCTGAGNLPGEEGSEVPSNPSVYTYVFEDNYPLVGDYDFNDVALDVTIEYNRDEATNHIQSTKISVTLAAVGASKFLGAGLRIVEVNKSAISAISYGGTGVSRFPATLLGSFFGTSIEEDNTFLTIPLFGNAHAVFDNVSNGTFINTVASNATITTPHTTATPYTYEITLEHTDKNQVNPLISKDNLDFFIAYQHRSMKKRMEVHLYEFYKYGATAAGTIQQENLDLAGNNTWAICVPNFRYPKEFINICDEAESSNCAYPRFLGWARDRNTNQDWYLYPNENNVYR